MTISPKILTSAIFPPPYLYSTEEILVTVEKWLETQPERLRKKVLKIFTSTQIQERRSVIPIESIFSRMSFEEKNNLYIEKMTDLAEGALCKALDQAQLEACDIDYIITTSCTGFMIPSVDAHLVERLGMKQQIERLPVTEMGCAGGTSALIYATHYLKAYPEKKVAVVALEAPTLTFQLDDCSMENFISAAIFADGAACCLLGGLGSSQTLPHIRDTQMYHFPQATHLMGFQLKNSGLKIVLDREVPLRIKEHFLPILLPFLEKNQLSLQDIQHFIFHPGGKRITDLVDSLFAEIGKEINESKKVLSTYGNMSSATVLYVLHRFMEKKIPSGDYGLMLAFGPGFTAQTLLLQWESEEESQK
jgi:alkylresorcinol/alkylpyrone synthase